MLKIYMNEPFSTRHELTQAKKLCEILSQKHLDDTSAWLCLNFSFGGKSIDAAYITSTKFLIIEFKAVGGFVNFGANIENAPWKWTTSDYTEHQISTQPYTNPFSQVKSYRTAVIGELEQRQKGFLKNSALLKNDTKFAWWVKGCVLLSDRTGNDVQIQSISISNNAKKWFGVGNLGEINSISDALDLGETISSKEITRLIENCIGLERVSAILEPEACQLLPQCDEAIDDIVKTQTVSRIDNFNKKYTPSKLPKVSKKTQLTQTNPISNSVKDISELEKLLNPIEKQQKNAPIIDKTESPAITYESNNTNYGFLKITLKGELAVILEKECTVKEMTEEEAINIVALSCPEIAPFKVSRVLQFGNNISQENAECIFNYLSKKHGENPSWYKIAYLDGYINLIFGKPILRIETQPQTSSKEELKAQLSINPYFVMPRWLRNFIDNSSEGLPTLSCEEVKLTRSLCYDDVLRYAKTYLPRSCAEAFVLVDWLLASQETPEKISYLDIGCGSGGTIIGCLLAMHKNLSSLEKISVDGIDINEHSLNYATEVINQARKNLRRNLIDDFNTIRGDFSQSSSNEKKYDIIMAAMWFPKVNE